MPQGPSLHSTQTFIEGRELRVSRTFQAPRELVYQVWTDPKHLPNWWGPDGFTLTIQDIEVKPGSAWRYIMHGPDGTDYDNVIRYLEVVPPERLVYNHGDTENEEWFHVTVIFKEQGNATELTMISLFPSEEELEVAAKQYGAMEGAKQTMDRLEAELKKLHT